MVRPAGLEPTPWPSMAYCLEGSCSVQLNYGRKGEKSMELVDGFEPTGAVR